MELQNNDDYKAWKYVLYGLHPVQFRTWKIQPKPEEDPQGIGNPVQVVSFILSNEHDFEQWLSRLNAQDGLQYAKICCQNRKRAGCLYIIYHCHKSGKRLIKTADRKRKPREGVSKKLGYQCTSKLIVRSHFEDGYVAWNGLAGESRIERIPVLEGQWSVTYHVTHVHEVLKEDCSEAPISSRLKSNIYVWKALGMSMDDIHDHLHSTKGGSSNGSSAPMDELFTNERVISKRDIRNIIYAKTGVKRESVIEDGQEMDAEYSEMLTSALVQTYGKEGAPVPPPFGGRVFTQEETDASHHVVKAFYHLQEGAAHLDTIGQCLGRGEAYATYKRKLENLRNNMLLLACKKLLCPKLVTKKLLEAESLQETDLMGDGDEFSSQTDDASASFVV